MIKKEIIVTKNKNLVELLQDYGFSYSFATKILRNKDVRVNGKATKDNLDVFTGDNVIFFYSEDMLEKRYDVIFENEDVYVIYKYAGIESAGEMGLEKILKNAIAVHRLDRNTEGVMVYAKSEDIAKKLEYAFKNHSVKKFYVAEVVGQFDVDQIFEAYLLKDAEKSKVEIFDKKKNGAVKIQTKIQTIKSGRESSLLKIELLTGKTHQIRAHLAFLGHPIIGDGKYGKNVDNKKFGQKWQKLACFLLKFDEVGVESLNYKQFKKLPAWLKVDIQ